MENFFCTLIQTIFYFIIISNQFIDLNPSQAHQHEIDKTAMQIARKHKILLAV